MLNHVPQSTRPEDRTPVPSSRRGVAAKLGLGAFLFFLIKGLLWLILPGALAAWAALKAS